MKYCMRCNAADARILEVKERINVTPRNACCFWIRRIEDGVKYTELYTGSIGVCECEGRIISFPRP